MFLNGIVNTEDTTPPISITLTAGTDTVPVLNYIFFDDTLGLQHNTTGFPHAVNEIKVGTVLLQSAATVQTYGPLKHHQWTDSFQSSEGLGEIVHVTNWIRNQAATWRHGVSSSVTITTNGGSADNVDYSSSEGQVLQVHEKTFPAHDTGGSDHIVVANDFATPYSLVTDLNQLLSDSAGVSMADTRFNLVFWGVVSEETGHSRVFVNLPSDTDNKDNDAISDKKGYANFSIPLEFKGTAFLISRETLRHQSAGSGTWTTLGSDDLRGIDPSNTIAGSGGATSPGGADTTFQYNDSGSFNGATNFYYDNVNNRVGLGIAAPTELLDVAGTAKVNLLKVGDGTVAAPSFTFSGDTNNGFYRIGPDSWATSVGGVQALSFSKSVGGQGNIAIGTTTTSSSIAFYIKRSQSTGTNIKIDNLTNSAGAYTGFLCETGTGVAGSNANNSGYYCYSGTSTTVALSGRIALWNFYGKGTSLIGQETRAVHGFYIGGNAESNQVMAVKDDEIVMAAAVISMANLPTSDPGVTGELWSNAGVLTIS